VISRLPVAVERKKCLSNLVKSSVSAGRSRGAGRLAHQFGKLVRSDNAHLRTASAKSHREGVDNHLSSEPGLAELLAAEYHRGLHDGRKDGEKILAETLEIRLAQERERIDRFLAGAGEQFQQLYQHSEQSVMKFALAVARLIMKREVRMDQDVVLRQVKDAVKRLAGVDRIKMRIHPDDENLVRHRRQDIVAGAESLREVIIEADPQVERGGCILESESGNIDSQLTTQIRKIEEALSNGLT